MPRRKRKGRAVRKNRSKAEENRADDESRAPHSFVLHRGKTGKSVQELTTDFRKVMEPFTAANLKVRPQNVIKDFVNLAGVLNVSHMVMFTRTERGPYVKFSRFPRGPTLTFRVHNYTLSRDVRSSLKRQVTYDKQYINAPLLILNGFQQAEGGEQSRHVSLMTSMFQNMFPSINVTTVHLNSIRRCVLLNYDAETGLVEFRHYTIKVVPVGMSRPVKKILQGKVPNLSRYDSMAEYLAGGGGAGSESEGEDDENSHCVVPQAMTSRGNIASQKSSVRLVELGPRISMELLKIEEGMLDGETLYHKHITKTDEEKKEIKRIIEKRKKEKAQRKQEQEKNVKKKEEAKAEHKQKSMAGILKKIKDQGDEVPAAFQGEVGADGSDGDASDSDNDAEYYKQEVGENPDSEMFDKGSRDRGRKRRAESQLDSRMKKRLKKTEQSGGGKKGPPAGSKGGQPKFKAKKGKPGTKAGDHRPGKSNKRDGKSKKGPARVFNSQGVGPNFNKKKGSAPPVKKRASKSRK